MNKGTLNHFKLVCTEFPNPKPTKLSYHSQSSRAFYLFPNYYTCRHHACWLNYWKENLNSASLAFRYNYWQQERYIRHTHASSLLLTQAWSFMEKRIILTLKMDIHSWQPWHSVIYKQQTYQEFRNRSFSSWQHSRTFKSFRILVPSVKIPLLPLTRSGFY